MDSQSRRTSALSIGRSRFGRALWGWDGGIRMTRRGYFDRRSSAVLCAVEDRKNDDLVASFVNSVDDNVRRLHQLAGTPCTAGSPHVGESRSRQSSDARAPTLDRLDGGARIVPGDPSENSFEVVRGFGANDYFHAPRRRRRLSSSASVRVGAPSSAIRWRNSAICSSFSRYGLWSCFSMSISSSAASCWRSLGQVKTRSRIAFTWSLVIIEACHTLLRPQYRRPADAVIE